MPPPGNTGAYGGGYPPSVRTPISGEGFVRTTGQYSQGPPPQETGTPTMTPDDRARLRQIHLGDGVADPLTAPNQFETLERRVVDDPQNVVLRAELARALETEATWAERQPSGEPGAQKLAAHARRSAAARQFKAAGRLTRAGALKYLFYNGAARAYAQNGDWENNYRCARAAVQAAPWITLAWKDYQRACMQVGRMQEYHKARNEVEYWSLPELRIL